MATASGIRVWGNVSLAQDTEIKTGANDNIVVTVNGTDYPITLNVGEYKTSHTHVTSELVQHIASRLTAAGCPVYAKVGGIHDDNPRTVLVIEAVDKEVNVTIAVSGNGATAFIGDKPYQVQPPVSASVPTLAMVNLTSRVQAKKT
ncbi:hypothetical protein [Paenibacillus pabuli]|uniref:Uncharacterized protein n=1 Tax=Paenibacillus pabuli TaxID=1472 RepID=A0A855YES4_9BACL|nr:hypothetical protein [Paenibacillus pabuli]PWW43796.1 hypothetical protein DET56_10222 [Paenibacillus pabuli]PXW09825.1 hypothetical protein DEU73_10222 [Paenibacillus taichungensis]